MPRKQLVGLLFVICVGYFSARTVGASYLKVPSHLDPSQISYETESETHELFEYGGNSRDLQSPYGSNTSMLVLIILLLRSICFVINAGIFAFNSSFNQIIPEACVGLPWFLFRDSSVMQNVFGTTPTKYFRKSTSAINREVQCSFYIILMNNLRINRWSNRLSFKSDWNLISKLIFYIAICSSMYSSRRDHEMFHI